MIPERIQVIRDQMMARQELLRRNGFRLKLPRAEFSLSAQSLIVHRKDGTAYQVPDSELVKMLEGAQPMPPEGETIMRWYARSGYRFGHEMGKLADAAEAAIADESIPRFAEADHGLERLSREYATRNIEDARLRELAELYGEEGERLQQLHTILYGTQKRLRFGTMEMHIIDADTAATGYAVSKGFFADLDAAYQCALHIRGYPRHSPSTGITYTGEQVNAHGQGNLVVDGREVDLEGEVTREGVNSRIQCSISLEPIALDIARVRTLTSVLLPDYDLLDDPEMLVARSENAAIMYNSSSSRLWATGEPATLEQETPRIMRKLGILERCRSA